METLSEYVTRIMEEKNLRPVDVAKKSKGAIGDSHVANIANGTTTNLTLEKLKGLALGLGVDPIEVFKVAIGYKVTEVNFPMIARVLNKLADQNLSKLILLLDRMNQRQLKNLLSAAEKAVDK